MRRRRFLCVWERGGGSAHLFQLLALVEAVQRAGHEVVLCVKDESYVRRAFPGNDIAIFGLPTILRPGHNLMARSHAELLYNLGFGRAAALRAYLERWRQMIDEIRPEAVFCDHADGALLASLSLSVPAIVIGNGFFHPPAETPIPAYELGLPVNEAEVARVESVVLNSINCVLKVVGSSVLGSLADLYAYAAMLVTTFPELDCFSAREGVDYLGSLGPTNRQAEPAWDHDGEKTYCYFTRGRLPDRDFVHQLLEGGYSLLISAPGIRAADRVSLARQGVTVVDHHVDLEQVCAECRLIFSEGNHGTTAKILRYGRAPMLIPRQVEQLATARRLQLQSMGVFPIGQIGQPIYLNLIDAINNDPAFERNAQLFSGRYHNWDEHQSAAKVQAAITGMLNF